MAATATELRRRRAAALGISHAALYHRERRESLARIDAGDTRPIGPSPWIGARIWPPVEPDHPAQITRSTEP